VTKRGCSALEQSFFCRHWVRIVGAVAIVPAVILSASCSSNSDARSGDGQQTQGGQSAGKPLIRVGVPPVDPPSLKIQGTQAQKISYDWFNGKAQDADYPETFSAFKLPALSIGDADRVEIQVSSKAMPIRVGVSFLGSVTAEGVPGKTISKVFCIEEPAECQLKANEQSDSLTVSLVRPKATKVIVVTLEYVSAGSASAPAAVNPARYNASYGVRIL
jgi:hypothetical protein